MPFAVAKGICFLVIIFFVFSCFFYYVSWAGFCLGVNLTDVLADYAQAEKLNTPQKCHYAYHACPTADGVAGDFGYDCPQYSYKTCKAHNNAQSRDVS